MSKEEFNVCVRDDGKVRISYWNKAAGETNIYCSKKAALGIRKAMYSMDLSGPFNLSKELKARNK